MMIRPIVVYCPRRQDRSEMVALYCEKQQILMVRTSAMLTDNDTDLEAAKTLIIKIGERFAAGELTLADLFPTRDAMIAEMTGKMTRASPKAKAVAAIAAADAADATGSTAMKAMKVMKCMKVCMKGAKKEQDPVKKTTPMKAMEGMKVIKGTTIPMKASTSPMKGMKAMKVRKDTTTPGKASTAGAAARTAAAKAAPVLSKADTAHSKHGPLWLVVSAVMSREHRSSDSVQLQKQLNID